MFPKDSTYCYKVSSVCQVLVPPLLQKGLEVRSGHCIERRTKFSVTTYSLNIESDLMVLKGVVSVKISQKRIEKLYTSEEKLYDSFLALSGDM